MNQEPRIALITGAGSGIGHSAALALLRDGWSVALTGRRREPLEATARAAGDFRDRTLVVPADVSDPPAVQALFGEVADAFGRLDLLFNNAGITAPGVPLEALAFADWQAVVDTNLTGVFLCTQEAFKLMKSQQPMGGRIINNGSISAHSPRPNSAPYTATKHAVTGLTKSAALDGRKYNIAVGQIDIGNAASQMTARMKEGVPQADGSLAPEPTIDVELVADAVVQMANLPLEANIFSMTIMATKMPYVGRG